MNTARHSKTKKIYSANQFEKLPQNEKNNIRNHLECEECQEKAFFRSKSRDGKTACFYSEHKNDCSMKNSNKFEDNNYEKTEENKRESDSDVFGILWTDFFRLADDERKNDLIDSYYKKGHSQKEYVKDPTFRTHSNLTLSKILHYAKNKILSQQDISIKLNNKIQKINNMIYHAHYLKNKEGQIGFFWGYFNSTDNVSWLNIDSNIPFNRFSIQLDEKIRKVFWARMGQVTEWKESVPFIVFGQLQMSSNGKPYIIIVNTKNLYIDKRKFNKNIK